jgi:hypothetical protein
MLGYLRLVSETDREKATALVREYERRADDQTEEDVCLFRAWALHELFLLGVIYGRRYRKDDGKKRGAKHG